MPAVRPRLCVWVGREMWVTQRTVTAGYYTIGDGWHMRAAVGMRDVCWWGIPTPPLRPVSFSMAVSVPGVSQAMGQAKRRWQMGT